MSYICAHIRHLCDTSIKQGKKLFYPTIDANLHIL